jgi:transporter family-2 protein
MNGLGVLLTVLISLIAGAVVPLQAGANAALGRGLGHPLWATLASLAVSAVAAMAVLALLRVPAPDLSLAMRGSAWTWLGGIFGVFYITAALMLAPRLGAGAFMAAVIAGQMLAALALDRYGLVGFAAKAITPGRLAGAALIVAGVVVMQLSTSMAAAAKAP